MEKILVSLFMLGIYLFGDEVQQVLSDESLEKIDAVNSFAPYAVLYFKDKGAKALHPYGNKNP